MFEKKFVREISHWSESPTNQQPQTCKPSIVLRNLCVTMSGDWVASVSLVFCWLNCTSGLFQSHTSTLWHWIYLTLSWISNSLETATLPLHGTALTLHSSYVASTDMLYSSFFVYSSTQENLQPELLPLTSFKNHFDLIFIQALLR